VSRRLEDTIRELCTRAVKARDVEEVTAICSELRGALNQYVGRLRSRAVGYVTPSERRSSPEPAKFSSDADDEGKTE